MIKRQATIISLVCGLFITGYAQDEFELDEDALFGDTSTIVESEAYIEPETMVDERYQKSVSFTGDVTGSAGGNMKRKYFENASLSNTTFQSSIFGNFNLDVRLPQSVKSYIDAEAAYFAASDSLVVDLNELFLDWNIGYNVYFRAGKQVLQWGRGYFFNPVDLVNVEKTSFTDELSSREGAFGLKVHVPFKTKANLYAFLDMGKVPRADSMALALKTEFLVKSTEFAFSAWGKNNVDPVFGFDISTGMFELIIRGEAALYSSLDVYEFKSAGYPSSSQPVGVNVEKREWVPRASVGVGRYFDIGNINDRLMINLEGYYNHAGSGDDDLIPEGMDSDDLNIEEIAGQIPPDELMSVFNQNNFSKWYLAFFSTFNRFIISDMRLTANALINLNQNCTWLSTGVNYTTMHDLSFDLIVTGFAGPKNTEYTVSGEGLGIEVRTGIRF